MVLVLLAIAGLVLVQNQTPMAVIFLGISSPMLPLGLWVIAAVAVGSMTMFLLALLVSIGGSGRSQPRSRPSKEGPNDPAPGSKPPRRRFGKQQETPIEDTTEVWDDDEAWDDRDRRVSQFVPDLKPPREPWELLEDDSAGNATGRPSAMPVSPDAIAKDFPVEPDEFDEPDELDEPGDQLDPDDRGEPLNLPPNSEYELQQQPVEVYRQGSVYSFSYEKKRSESKVPLNLGETTESRQPSGDQRVPLDLPNRPESRQPDPLDALEEITPIIEPDDRPATSANPTRPPRSPRPVDSRPASQDKTPNRTPTRPTTPESWDQDWSQPNHDDSDWI